MKFCMSEGVALHHTVEGLSLADGGASRRPLVFINSLGSDLRIWDDVIPAFTEHSSIIRYDKRGHGLSDCPPPPYSIHEHAEDLAGLLASLEIEKAILIGISVGGMIAMDYAINHPGQVDRLVLCDTFPKIGSPEMWHERIGTLREHGMVHLGEAILSRWFAPRFGEAQPAAYRGYIHMLTRTPLDGYTGTCEAIRDADMRADVGNIDIKTLVLCGAEDLATPPALGQELAEMMPNARFEEIAGAAHLPCVEQPTCMSALIEAFLNEE